MNSLDRTKWTAPAQPPNTLSTPNHPNLSTSQTKWADPAPLPSYMLATPPPTTILGHNRPQPTLSPTTLTPLSQTLSPIYDPNPQTPFECDTDFTLSPPPLTFQPYSNSPMNVPRPPPAIQPYSTKQLTILNDICVNYPHLNYSYLYLQYAPISYLCTHNLI